MAQPEAPFQRFFRWLKDAATMPVGLEEAARFAQPAERPVVDLDQEASLFSRWENRMIHDGGAVPTDGPDDRGNGRLTIKSSRLRSGATYRFSGDLVVEGSTPDDLKIETKGHLVVLGNSGARNELTAMLPEALKRVTQAEPGQPPVERSRFETTGLLYPNDPKPGITIDGIAGEGSRLTSNAGLALRGQAADVTLDPGRWGRGIAVNETPEVPMDRVPVPLPKNRPQTHGWG